MKLRFLFRALKARYRDQSVELKIIKKNIRANDIVCDIGANKGSYLFWLSRWVPSGRVIAFEPQVSLAAYLRTLCDTLGLPNVTVEPKAVHAKAGNLTLYVPGEEDAPGASLSTKITRRKTCRTVDVPVVSLDEYFDPSTRIGILKIDAEGAEKGVFEGAARILKQHSPILIFECENRHLESGSILDTFEYLKGLGYSGEFVCHKTLRPLNEFNPAIHQKQEGDRFWDAKDYCNNFIFRKRA